MLEFNLIARKIDFAQWEPPTFPRENNLIGADVVRECLKTKGNAISLWYCSEDENSTDEIVIEIASKREFLDRANIIIVPFDAIKKAADSEGFKVNPEEITTAVKGLENQHINLENLTISDLVKIAGIIANSFRNEPDSYKREYSKSEVKKLFISMARDGRLDKNKVNIKLIEKYSDEFRQ